MQFKYKNINIIFSFSFFALIIILNCFNKTEFLYPTIIFAILHETGHLLALKYFKVPIREFKISLIGGNIKTYNKKIKYSQEAIISFCGPLINLILFVVFYVLYVFYNKKIFHDIFVINLVLSIFNLLPFYGFDGGKILSSLLSNFLDDNQINLIITITSFLILIPFSYIAFKVFILNFKDFYMLIASVLMLLTIIFKK